MRGRSFILGENVMKKLILLAVILFSVFAISASAQTKVPIKFAKNTSQKSVAGSIKGSDYIDYTVRFAQYDQIGIDLSSGNKKLKFTIRKPDGTELENGVDVRKFDGEADKTGTYTIRVYDMGNGSGVTKFRLKVEVYLGT
jgi:uncharacterized protein involved in high-affinity Fe2+ transport